VPGVQGFAVVVAGVRAASIRVVNPAAARTPLAQGHGQRRERQVALDIPTGRPPLRSLGDLSSMKSTVRAGAFRGANRAAVEEVLDRTAWRRSGYWPATRRRRPAVEAHQDDGVGVY